MGAINVVRPPTAAPRKVHNLRYSDQRKAGRAARNAEPWPGEYINPVNRKADKLAAELRSIEQTPAIIAVSAILASLDAETYDKVLKQLAPAIRSDSVPARQALAMTQACRLDFGSRYFLQKALDRLQQEGQ